MSDAASYRDFSFPLNVFMHVLTCEEGHVGYLHYGFFERTDEPIAVAQERSTAMLLARLPPPPARLLEVGAGLGTTLARLTRAGYDAEGITPDQQQVATIRKRFGSEVRVTCAAFESFAADEPYDAVLFQESSQYIDGEALFAKARSITRHVVVGDEFASTPLAVAGALHDLPSFCAAAAANQFEKIEEVDVSAMAAPTIAYVNERIEKHRQALITDLHLEPAQLDALLESGRRYRESYANGTYVYRLLQFRR